MKLYLAGTMSGHAGFNFPEFGCKRAGIES